MRHLHLKPMFVENIPDVIDVGVLYVSMEHATTIHACCCGCGEEVVTPLSPTDWKLTYNGVGVSLWPSIGNWNSRCRSHYIIDNGNVIGAGSWSKERIEGEQARDRRAKAAYYSQGSRPRAEGAEKVLEVSGLWSKFRRWWNHG